MFKWCAYCQHLIGEAEPLDSYEMTHGVCARCEPAAAVFKPTPNVLKARSLLDDLRKAGRSRRPEDLDRFMSAAAASGIPGSEILIGVIQPALYEIGVLWESKRIFVEDEHRFTALCQEIFSRLPPAPWPSEGGPLILLALVPGNQHDVGANMLQRLCAERGIRCRVLPTGSTEDEILAEAVRSKPAMIGVSVAMPESENAAARLLSRCRAEVAGAALAVGGLEARSAPADAYPGARVSRRVDDFLALIEGLRSGHAGS